MFEHVVVSPGDRYGRWTVLCEVERTISQTNSRSYRMVKCQCDCGTVGHRTLESLRQKRGSTSCGCSQKEAARRSGIENRKHGFTGTITYESWSMMKQRCTNENHMNYCDYGGRGIRVCDRWMESFEAFLADMGERPSPHHSIDRFPDTNGNYEPNNCRWATSTEQARNRRGNVNLTFRGETMCIAAWAERIGLPRKTLEKRLNKHGFTVEDALTRPLRILRPRK